MGDASEEKSRPESRSLPPCRVCGQAAHGLHYGVNTCIACKGFFKRSLLRHTRYKCQWSEKCKITANGICCAACRFKKCLSVGMSKDVEYITEMRLDATMENGAHMLSSQKSVDEKESIPNSTEKNGNLEGSEDSNPVLENLPNGFNLFRNKMTNSSPSQVESKNSMTSSASKEPKDDDMSDLVKFTERLVLCHKKYILDLNSFPEDILQEKIKRCREKCHLKEEFRNQFQENTKTEFDALYCSPGVAMGDKLFLFKDVLSSLNLALKQIIRFQRGIPEFKSLSIPTQIALTKGSYAQIAILSSFNGFDDHKHTCVDLFRSYCIHDLSHLFMSNGCGEFYFTMAKELKSLNLTLEMVVLIKVIVLFCPANAGEKEKESIKQFQQKCLRCFLLLLQKHFPTDYNEKFKKITEIINSLESQSKMFGRVVVSDKPSCTVDKNETTSGERICDVS